MRGSPSNATIAYDSNTKTRPWMGAAMTTTTYKAQAADIKGFASTAEAERIAEGASSTAAPTPNRMSRAYERFLQMPVLVVLGVLWVGGAALLGSLALALYMAASLLVPVIAGAL
jgi:hypothetical protein